MATYLVLLFTDRNKNTNNNYKKVFMIKRQKWGRPPKIDSDKRTLRVRVSFTADEYQKLKARCHASGVAKISDLVRAIALNEKKIDSKPAIRHVELIHWLAQLNRLAADINEFILECRLHLHSDEVKNDHSKNVLILQKIQSVYKLLINISGVAHVEGKHDR